MSADKLRLVVLTTGRQDFGILRSTLTILARDLRFSLRLWVGGMHLKSQFGNTVDAVRETGLSIARELDFLDETADPVEEFATALAQVDRSIVEDEPDALLLMGDRSETLAAAIAATLRRIPIAHLHGGEESEGAIDNVSRHAITKMSHLHLVSHPVHSRRVIQMGEDPENVVVVGAPGLDNLYRDDLPSVEKVAERLGLALADPLIVVTLHPTTLGGDPAQDVAALSSAMENIRATFIITGPNADPGNEAIRNHWQSWTASRKNAVFVESLGEDAYWTMMRRARVVVGNSSSGIIEAPVAGARVINIGDRQKGRLRLGSVVDVPFETSQIKAAIERALKADAPARIKDGYPAGPTGPRIVEALANWKIERPPRKAFRDLECRSTS